MQTTNNSTIKRGDHIETTDGRTGLVCGGGNGSYLVRYDNGEIDVILADQIKRNFGH